MISEQQAKSLFSTIQMELVRSILDSWAKIHKSNLHFKSRSRASLMWDETLYLLNIAWCDSTHINKIEEKKSQTAHYWFDQDTFFRIKKSNKQGYTKNYPTQTAWEFHQPQSDLFGLVNRLEVTYILSQDETKIIDIAVVHREDTNINFRFSLLEAQNVEALPRADSGETRETKKEGVAKLKPYLEKTEKTEPSHEE